MEDYNWNYILNNNLKDINTNLKAMSTTLDKMFKFWITRQTINTINTTEHNFEQWKAKLNKPKENP